MTKCGAEKVLLIIDSVNGTTYLEFESQEIESFARMELAVEKAFGLPPMKSSIS
jgi:hypothetical protein